MKDHIALGTIWFLRTFADTLSRYDPNKMNERKWLDRCVFLETVAGVPGMIGAVHRHMRSLRTLEQDRGWIHHLLQEAENERMHLFFFLQLRNPGFMFRGAIFLVQYIAFVVNFIAYAISPTLCHRAVGYLEEEAVHTYTMLLEQLDAGKLPEWTDMPCPPAAREYYDLPRDAKMRDLFLNVRADEATHRELNHYFGDIPAYKSVEHVHVTVKGD